MNAAPRLFRTILCPVDFSEHSRQALAYAALLAARYRARLIVIFVEDPLLASAAAVAYNEKTVIDKGRTALTKFVERTTARYGLPMEAVTLDVAVGKPYKEIEWTAERFGCDLIVMGAHGWTGANRMMLGSTTHRVLRRSPLPVLATPPVRGRVRALSASWPGKRVMAPVDIGIRDRADAHAAAVVAHALGAELQLMHVLEPIDGPHWLEVDTTRRDKQRERRAMARLTWLKDDLAWTAVSCRVESGKPARKIAAIALATAVDLVIMTRRRGRGLFGARQGSISYQVLCEAKVPVLALPAGRTWMRRVIALTPKRPAA